MSRDIVLSVVIASPSFTVSPSPDCHSTAPRNVLRMFRHISLVVIFDFPGAFDGDEIVFVAAAALHMLLSRDFPFFMTGAKVRGDGDF